MKQNTDVLSKHPTMMCHGLIYFRHSGYEVEEKAWMEKFRQTKKLGICNICAEGKILVMNNTKWYEIL